MQNLEFKMIDNLPISPLGFIVSKRCKWCYRALGRITGAVYCCIDCKEEYEDWSYLQSYKNKLFFQRQYERAKKANQAINTNLKLKQSLEDRKKYLREYDKKRKEKKREYYLANREKIIKQVAINKLNKKQNDK